jgi:hypothetical protein
MALYNRQSLGGRDLPGGVLPLSIQESNQATDKHGCRQITPRTNCEWTGLTGFTGFDQEPGLRRRDQPGSQALVWSNPVNHVNPVYFVFSSSGLTRVVNPASRVLRDA